jgi:hypothetical protein
MDPHVISHKVAVCKNVCIMLKKDLLYNVFEIQAILKLHCIFVECGNIFYVNSNFGLHQLNYALLKRIHMLRHLSCEGGSYLQYAYCKVCRLTSYDIIKLLDGPRIVNSIRYLDCGFLIHDTMLPYMWISCGTNMLSLSSGLKCVEWGIRLVI